MSADLHPIFLVEELVKLVGLVGPHGHSLIPKQVLYSWVVMAVLIGCGWLATRKLSLVPKGAQNFFEFLIGSLEEFVVANMGEAGRKVFPVLCTLFMYILCCNVGGMIPGGDAPTANINTTASMAVFVFGKPLSVPQGIIGLMTRFGMEVSLAHPEGYEVMPEVEKVAIANAQKSGGSFSKTNNMAEAFAGADIVYPKSWAPFAAMEKRTDLYGKGDFDGIKALEKDLLAQNAKHKDWECTEDLMSKTKDGKALYMHCLPADITGVSCEQGEVAASVFDRYRVPMYKEAGYKPYIIAAMIFLSKFADAPGQLDRLLKRGTPRIY